MSDTINNIDNYFNNLLSAEEKAVFEKKCETDNDFANEVALYVISRDTVRNELLEQKKTAWKQLGNQQQQKAPATPGKVVNMKPWVLIAVAASVIAAVLLILPLTKSNPQQLASTYVKEHLQTLSVTMDASRDSLQMGIELYNKRKYPEAAAIFTAVYDKNKQLTDALKYKGLANVMDENYDAAIAAFDELAAKENLFANPGLFYKALTLLQRNVNDDRDNAKKLLQIVVDKNLDGQKEAAGWLKNW